MLGVAPDAVRLHLDSWGLKKLFSYMIRKAGKDKDAMADPKRRDPCQTSFMDDSLDKMDHAVHLAYENLFKHWGVRLRKAKSQIVILDEDPKEVKEEQQDFQRALNGDECDEKDQEEVVVIDDPYLDPMFPCDLDPVVEKDVKSNGECQPKIPDMAKPAQIPVDDDVVCCSPPMHVQLASIELRMQQIRPFGSGFIQLLQLANNAVSRAQALKPEPQGGNMDNMETLPFLSQEFPDEYMLNDEFSPATVVTPSPLPGKEAPTITPDRIEPLCRGLAVQFEKVIEENEKTFEACPAALASTGPQGVETNKEDTEKISQPTMEEKKVSLQVEADQKGSEIEGEAACSSGTQPAFEKPDATSIEPDITMDESQRKPETTKEPTAFFDKPETGKDHQPDQTMTSPAQVNPGIFQDSLPDGVAPEGEMDQSNQLQPDIENHDQPPQEASEVKDAKPVAEHPHAEELDAESDKVVEIGSPSMEELLDAGMEADSKAPVVLRRDQYAQKKENNPPGRRGRPPKKDGEKAKPKAKAKVRGEAKAKARGAAKAKAKGEAKAKAPRARPSRAVRELGKSWMDIDMIIPPTPALPRVPEVADNLVPPPAKPAEEIKPEPKRRCRKRVASAPAAEAAPSSSSSVAPAASEPSKRRKKDKKGKGEGAHGADGANHNADVGEKQGEENKVEKDKLEKNKGEDEGDDKGETKVKVKSFARRCMPKTNPSQFKWLAIRDHFKENVSPELVKFMRFPGKLEDQGDAIFLVLLVYWMGVGDDEGYQVYKVAFWMRKHKALTWKRTWIWSISEIIERLDLGPLSQDERDPDSYSPTSADSVVDVNLQTELLRQALEDDEKRKIYQPELYQDFLASPQDWDGLGLYLRLGADGLTRAEKVQADKEAAWAKCLKAVSWPEMDDDALPSAYMTKVLSCLGKWQLKMGQLCEQSKAVASSLMEVAQGLDELNKDAVSREDEDCVFGGKAEAIAP
eukprot:s2049_g8.t1